MSTALYPQVLMYCMVTHVNCPLYGPCLFIQQVIWPLNGTTLMDTWNGCAMEGWLKAFPIVLSTGHIVDWSTQIIRQNGQLPMVCVREACLLYNGSYQQTRFRKPARGSLGEVCGSSGTRPVGVEAEGEGVARVAGVAGGEGGEGGGEGGVGEASPVASLDPRAPRSSLVSPRTGAAWPRSVGPSPPSTGTCLSTTEQHTRQDNPVHHCQSA